MDNLSKAMRKSLREMAPVLAIPYIRSFQLTEEEERILILCECKRKSLQQVALLTSLSVETVKRRRRSALRKMTHI